MQECILAICQDRVALLGTRVYKGSTLRENTKLLSKVIAPISTPLSYIKGFPGGPVVKDPSAIVGDAGSMPGSGRSPGRGHGNPLQYSSMKNPMDRGAWQATVIEDHKELDMIEATEHACKHPYINMVSVLNNIQSSGI